MKNLKNWKKFNEGISSYNVKGKGIIVDVEDLQDKIKNYVFNNFDSNAGLEGSLNDLDYYKMSDEFFLDIFDLFTPLESEYVGGGDSYDLALTFSDEQGKVYLTKMSSELNLGEITDIDVSYIQ